MRLAEFQALVDRIARDVPEEYLDGVAAVDVSPRTVPHPVHPDVFTMGECIPIDTGTDEVVSRVVLYHGSFRALAQLNPDFDWQGEVRETLLHELRHHLEWQAGAEDLEAYDWAVEQNHRRLDGQPFDPLFFQAGERIDEGVYRIEDEIFFEQVVRRVPARIEVSWRGVRYGGTPNVSSLPAFLALDGLGGEPTGDVYLVLRRKPGLMDLFRSSPQPEEQRLRVTPIP